MAPGSGLGKTALLAGLLTTVPQALGQQTVTLDTPNGGIRTDRLSPKELREWNSIREIVFAKDRAGRLLHPRLHGLWQSAESSGHMIFVELRKREERANTKAGDMVLEKVDPDGGQHTVDLRLFLSTINRAFAERRLSVGSERFEPFAGLSRKVRYAEVLGHELAHIERVFADPNYLRLYVELDRQLNSYSSRRHSRKGQELDQEEQKQLERIDLLVNEIERPALAAEAEIWNELLHN